MIERYTLPEMGAVWSEQSRFQKWLDFEIRVCEVLSENGEVPKDAVERIRSRASFRVERIKEIEQTVDHDVIAFLTNLAEYIGEDSRYVHLGLTSSDLLDTTLSLQLKEAGELLAKRLGALRAALLERAEEHRHTPMVGRTHGVHAEPTTFGLKLLIFYDELGRRAALLDRAVEVVSVGKASGAVGNFAHLPPAVETRVMEKLGLAAAPVSNQVVQRDRHAEFVSALALVGASIEKMAVEFRGLQRTEVLEVEERFKKGQKGSSSMPHKKNPIVGERLTGMARLLRGYAVSAVENVALWHERDISHSSVERVILPDATIVLDYMLVKAEGLVRHLVVHTDRMLENLERTNGLVYSQKLLLELARTGLSREDAYALVQESAMETWRTGLSFEESVAANEAITLRVEASRLAELFDPESFQCHVDAIFERVVGS